MHILATVTFNPNQLRAHLEPLIALPEVASIVLVSDESPPSLPKLRSVVPPRWLTRVLGRAGAKLLICCAVAIRDRPDWVIGFNLVPHGANAVIAAATSRTRSLYYMIGGEIEWEGGGWRADNPLFRSARPRPVVEKLLLFFVRRATAIAVMGPKGRTALISRGIPPERIHIVPASVDPEAYGARDESDRDYDVVSIGSLIERKRMEDVVRAVSHVRESRGSIRAAIMGEGPLEPLLRELAERLGVSDAIDFLGFSTETAAVLARSRVFVLASRNEGLPIAIGEAMAAGIPVVVTDVGEARSLVEDGVSGFLSPVARPDVLADRIEQLLADPDLRASFAASAREASAELLRPESVSDRYRAALGVDVGAAR